jgi:hypothetical protein
MLTILEKRFINLQRDMDILNIHKHFNITNATISLLNLNTLEISFETTVNENIIQFMKTIQFIKTSEFNKLSVPTDVLNLIISYIPHRLFLDVNLHVEYPIQYPFRQPVWTFNYVNTNIKHNEIILEEYYKTMMKNHTNSYITDWSPAMQLHMDYLVIYMKLNHFDELIERYI